MAANPAIDWVLAQVLFAQGLRPLEIAQRIGASRGAVAKRAERGEWSRLRDAVKADAVVAVSSAVRDAVSPETRQLLESSAKARHALANELIASVDTLATTKRKRSMREQRERSTVLSTLATAAKTIHGWSDGAQHTPAVRIGVMNIAAAASKAPRTQIADPLSPVVDVTPTAASGPTA